MDGIYTMLFIYTMALMCSFLPRSTVIIAHPEILVARPKFAAANKWLLASLTILYGFTIAHLGIQWVYTRQIYLLNGDSPDDMLNAIFDESLTMVMASSTLNVASTLIADGILVSIRILFYPHLIFMLHIGLEMLDYLEQRLEGYRPSSDHPFAEVGKDHLYG